jgi:hypothetical protein
MSYNVERKCSKKEEEKGCIQSFCATLDFTIDVIIVSRQLMRIPIKYSKKNNQILYNFLNLVLKKSI